MIIEAGTPTPGALVPGPAFADIIAPPRLPGLLAPVLYETLGHVIAAWALSLPAWLIVAGEAIRRRRRRNRR